MPQFKDFLASLSMPLEEKDWPPGTDDSYPECNFLRDWGFTIYRTAYHGPDSDRLWQALLADIQAQVAADVFTNRRAEGEDADEAREVLSLFRLDPRSDETRLAGLSIQQVRELFLQDASEEQLSSDEVKPMNWRPQCVGSHLFLLVDDEVMEAAALSTAQWNEPRTEGGPWIKCVYADYRVENYVPRNTRVTQTFFGWIKITTRCLVGMSEDLDSFRELEKLAPIMHDKTGQNSEIYDGDIIDVHVKEQRKRMAM